MAPPPFPAPLVVVGLSVFATIFTEVLTLVLVASSSTYKRLVADIDRAAKARACMLGLISALGLGQGHLMNLDLGVQEAGSLG